MKNTKNNQPDMLLHICCGGCGAYVSSLLKTQFQVTLYFCNPNIYPPEEYEKRLNETKQLAKKLNLALLVGDYDHVDWLTAVAGYENEPEGGKRCLICYRERLFKTAELALRNNFIYYATSLSISPYKDAKMISALGRAASQQLGINFFNQDFKKNDGFKKSVSLSRELKLYRQSYCGCEFSLKESRLIKEEKK